jgi:hypothetical protein
MTNLARPLRIFLWSYVFIYAVFTSLSITQVDLWWQLAEGRHILHTLSLPTGPVVAFGLPATPYFDEYAGYETVLALLYHFTGFIGLWVTFAAIYLVILFLPGATTGRKYPSFDLTSTLALVAAILLIHPRLEQRPELVGVLLQVILMVKLRASTKEKISWRLLAGLFLLFLAWSNTHSTFLFGFFTLGLWLVNELWLRSATLSWGTLLRRGAMLGTMVLVAAMITPYGPRRLLFPFLEASDPGSTALSPEMWPILEYPPLVVYIYFAAMALLAWGLFTTRGLPFWLIAFAVFSVVVSFRSFRFTDFAAVSLLFIYAARNEQAADKVRPWPWFLSIPRDVLLVFVCLFFLFMDVFDILGKYGEMREELRFATHGLRYASDMAAYPVPSEGRRIPVLCGHGMGSYLSFEGNGNFRPLLDSGLSHFSDDTKRYFFFVWNEPDALSLALKRLNVDYLLLDLETHCWIPTIQRLPDWQFVTCSPNGMILRRSPGGPHPPSAEDRVLLAKVIRELQDNGSVLSAFTYSTLLDRPADSLAILAQYHGEPWKELFFNSLSAWIDALPPAEAQAFLATNSCPQCPLLGAMLSARIGPEAYDHYVASHPGALDSWYGKAVAVEVALKKGDVAGARRIFNSISPVPVASTTYYRLWHAVHVEELPEPDLSSYGRWQTWDDNGRTFIEEMSMRLNDRISDLDRTDRLLVLPSFR